MKFLISLVFLVLVFSSCGKPPEFKSNLPWKPYSKQAIEDSMARHKPVMIDFGAEWCPNCHELERTVFADPLIQAKLAQVTVLKMDATNQDDPAVQQIIQDYDIDGVPTIVFLDSRGKEIQNSRIIGLVTPREFNQVLAMLDIFK